MRETVRKPGIQSLPSGQLPPCLTVSPLAASTFRAASKHLSAAGRGEMATTGRDADPLLSLPLLTGGLRDLCVWTADKLFGRIHALRTCS